MSDELDGRLLLLNEDDNVFVARVAMTDGTLVQIGGRQVPLLGDAPVGFKIARGDIPASAPIIKYGAAIGSTLRQVAAGEMLHLHNMKSDYLPTYTLDGDGFTKRGTP